MYVYTYSIGMIRNVVRLHPTTMTTRLLLLAIASWAFTTNALAAPIADNGQSDYVIIVGEKTENDRFAATEFQSILKQSTKADLPIINANDPQSRSANKRIFIGDSPLIRSLLGEQTITALKDQQSLVTYKGDDIFIIGGGRNGTAYGVYHFLEEELGFRCYSPYPGGIRIPEIETFTPSGRQLTESPAFDLYRVACMLYLYEKTGPRYQFSNRGNIRYKLTNGQVTINGIEDGRLPMLDRGHGFHLYITTERTKNFYKWEQSKDYFKTNPEYFTLDRNGNRTERGQLCFSNPQLRDEFTRRIIERGKHKGGRGILVVGANDWPGHMCYCDPCKQLEAKYDCLGGPLYDYLLEACPRIAKVLPDIKISTLAYRKKQSEIPPKGIEKMPENWICDFAPVDDDQGQFLDGERNLGTLENLKQWNRITKDITYWYYICINSAPFGLVQRLSHDMKLMYENGVRGVGTCGLGSPGMFPMQEYIMFRLMIDPDQDPWPLIRDYNEHHYGDAASEMTQYVRELDEVWLEPKKFISLSHDGKAIPNFTPQRLIRWQKMFDALEVKLADKPEQRKNLAIARWDIDMLTLSHYPVIRKTDLGYDINPDQIIQRMRKVDLRRPWVFQKLDKRAEMAYLTCKALNKPLPAQLAQLPAGQVIQLPQCGGQYPFKDPDAACGEAKTQYFRENQMQERNKQIGFDIYDNAAKRTMKHGTIDATQCTPGKYELYFVTKTPIARGGMIAFDSWWGIQESLAPYYPEGDEFKEFEIWASLKFVGPSFGIKTEDGKDRMYCDRLFLVDRQAPSPE